MEKMVTTLVRSKPNEDTFEGLSIKFATFLIRNVDVGFAAKDAEIGE